MSTHFPPRPNDDQFTHGFILGFAVGVCAAIFFGAFLLR